MASLSGISNLHRVPEVRQRVLYTLMMLAVYRLGSFITIPGIDRTAIQSAVGAQGWHRRFAEQL
jgi:preprotein translocase subunit SecY